MPATLWKRGKSSWPGWKAYLIRREMTETDPVDPDLEHRLARIPEWGNRMLRVIVNGKTTPRAS
jgi:hypothetical protein